MSRLNEACVKANAGFKEFQLGNSTLALKDFILKELCDVYLEAMKPVMYNESSDPQISSRQKSALDTLYTCLDNVFRMLHPFMPFVTEELWQRLPRRSTDLSSIMISSYPSSLPLWSNPAVEVC